MFLEYLELKEEMKKEKELKRAAEPEAEPKVERRVCVKSFKSNTRVFNDNSIEVTPQATGEPSQREVKKVGRSKRYVTTGKNPLVGIELKCPESEPDKVAYFQKELAKLTKDMAVEEPKLPEKEYLLNRENVKVSFSAKEGRVVCWLTFEVKGQFDVRKELYSLTSEIDKCFVINESLINRQK